MASGGSIQTHGRVTVGNTATLIRGVLRRRQVIIRNIGDGATGVTVYLGDSTVTVADGMPLEPGADTNVPGATEVIDGNAAVYGIVAAGTQDVAFQDFHD